MFKSELLISNSSFYSSDDLSSSIILISFIIILLIFFFSIFSLRTVLSASCSSISSISSFICQSSSALSDSSLVMCVCIPSEIPCLRSGQHCLPSLLSSSLLCRSRPQLALGRPIWIRFTCLSFPAMRFFVGWSLKVGYLCRGCKSIPFVDLVVFFMQDFSSFFLIRYRHR